MTDENRIIDEINSMPTKRLFIDVLTRDISVEACILDLIDNSVDSYIRNEIIDRSEILLSISKDEFGIFDNCGGIEYNFLKTNVFRFGADILIRSKPTLGIYGIGMKRAILKIGRKILMETDDGNSYCKINLDVNEWSKSEDWKIPFEYYKGSRLSTNEKPYTKIVIKDLYDNIKKRFDLDSFINNINKAIHITYTFFITHNIDFYVNDDVKIEPFVIEARYDDQYKPTKYQDCFEGVDFEITCFIDPKKGRTTRELGKRGWNVFCNKRLILAENTTEITGWSGPPELPKYHFLYNEFRGIVLIQSEDPSKLPLNTSKTGLDTESPIYHHIRNLMIKKARPLIDHLSRKYDGEKEALDEVEERMEDTETKAETEEEGESEKIRYVPLEEIKVGSTFRAPKMLKPRIKMTSVQYSKPEKIVEKVKQSLGVSSNKKVGEKTFEYYVDLEGIKDD